MLKSLRQNSQFIGDVTNGIHKLASRFHLLHLIEERLFALQALKNV